MKKKLQKIFLAIILAASVLFPFAAEAAWTYTLSTPNPSVPAANVCPGAVKVPIYYFTIAASGSGTASNITQNFSFTTNPGYAATSVSQFSLYRNITNNLGTAILMNSVAASGPGLQTITAAFTYALNSSGATYHFWITMNVAAAPTIGNTVSVAAISWSNITLSGTPTKNSGSISAGGTQSIIGIVTQPTGSSICSGGTATLNIAMSSGPAWTYQWQYNSGSWNNVVNGTPAGAIYSGNNTASLTVSGLTANAQYRCVVGGACVLTSGNATVAITPPTIPPQLYIYAQDYLGNTIGDNSNPNVTICELQTIDFYVSAGFIDATPNTFTWKKNGLPVSTQTNVLNYFSSTWQTSALVTGDVVTLEVSWPTPTTSPIYCFSPTTRVSQALTFTVTANQPPVVAISHNFPTDTICRGNQVTFSAATFNAGSPAYQWFLDGTPVGTAFQYTTLATLSAGTHNIWCEIVSNEACDLMDPVYTQWTSSAPITLIVNNCYYYVPTTSTLGPYYSCGSPFYDSQMDNPVNYSNNVNGLTKLCPAVAGQYVTISFTSMALNDAGDRLKIFSGTPASTWTADTSAVPLFNLAGPTSSAGCGSVVTSNVSGGCLTVHFKSDGAGNAAGWVSNLTCSSTPSPGPLLGSTCANPIVISSLPYSVTNHSTQCYGADYTSQTGICNTSYTGEDRVYQYTATGPECTSITLSATTGTPTLSVYSGCPGTVGTICITPIPQSGNSTAQVTFPSAGTYYIIVDNAGGPTAYSSYNLYIQSFGLAPANDLPCNAQYIDLLVSVNGNTACTGSASEPAATPSCWTSGNINATWHSFIAPASGAVRIRTSPGTIGYTQIGLYSLTGSCSNPANYTLMACNRIGPPCNAANPLLTSSEIAFSGLTPSTMYYVRVDGTNNNTGNYSIIVVDQSTPVSQQPYVAGQDCVVPLPICSPMFSIPSPGFYGTGWVCDFAQGSNGSCLTSGELNSLWLVFNTSGPGTVSWKLKPYGTNPPQTDYDWVLMNITTFGTDQATRVANACVQINANNLPQTRCNLTGAQATFPACCTDLYCTGMCPSAPNPVSPGFGDSYNSSVTVSGGETFLLFLMNHWQNNIGFTIDFNAFGVSPIIYQSPPAVVFWTGTVSTDWFNAANWGNCGPPDCNTNAILYSGALNYPVIPTGPTATCKRLDVKAGASITLTGTAQLDICGNFVNNGTLTAATTSTVRVMGSNAQYFDGSMMGSNAFGNLWMNKPSNHMTILDNANVAGNLQLGAVTGGKIITGIKTLRVTNPAPGAISSFGAGSYVEGNLRRNLNGLPGTYYFPIGTAIKGFNLAQVDFTSNHTIPSILSYFNNTAVPIQPGPLGPECPTNDFATLAPFNNGYWTFTAEANASSATYNMLLYSNMTTVTNNTGNAWTILKNPGSGWTLNGNCNGTSTASIAKRDGMTGFSDFTVGQSGTPLPVELLSFDALKQGEAVLTTWVTATEINNNYFVVERSADGINFEIVGKKNGAGNSSVTLYYSLADETPLKGISYYRLRQVDFDGKESLSQLVAVSFLDNNTLSVFPNPSKQDIKYRFNSVAEGTALFELIDALGKTILSEQVTISKGLNTSEAVDIRFIPDGVYFVRITSLNNTAIQPMQTVFVKRTMEE